MSDETPPPAGNPPAEGKEKGKEKTESSINLATQAAARLDVKMKSLLEKEKQIDQKIKDYDAFIKATEAEGTTRAGGQQQEKKETPAQYKDRVMSGNV